MLTEEKKQTFRKLLASMERRKNKAFIVQCKVDGDVLGEYDMETERTIDSKTPQQWLNLCFFDYEINKRKGELGLKVKMKE